MELGGGEGDGRQESEDGDWVEGDGSAAHGEEEWKGIEGVGGVGGDEGVVEGDEGGNGEERGGGELGEELDGEGKQGESGIGGDKCSEDAGVVEAAGGTAAGVELGGGAGESKGGAGEEDGGNGSGIGRRRGRAQGVDVKEESTPMIAGGGQRSETRGPRGSGDLGAFDHALVLVPAGFGGFFLNTSLKYF